MKTTLEKLNYARQCHTVTVYEYMFEICDGRAKESKELFKELDRLSTEFGKNSKEVNSFFSQIYRERF